MTKYKIKRYGTNPYGADPNWIKEQEVVVEGTDTTGWEVMTYSELKREWKSFQSAHQTWLDSINNEIVRISASNYTDYKKAREALKSLIAAKGGFDNLNYLEKQKATEWFVCTPNEMTNYFINEVGLTQQQALDRKITNSVDFNTRSTESRKHRYDAAFVFIRNVLKKADFDLISDDVETYKLKQTYIELGKEGSMKTNYEGVTDNPGIFDYVQGTTAWTDLGYSTLASKISTPEYGLTVTNVINKSMDILDNGNYVR